MNNYNKTLKQLILNKRQRKPKGQSRMDTQATLGTQDTGKRQTK